MEEIWQFRGIPKIKANKTASELCSSAVCVLGHFRQELRINNHKCIDDYCMSTAEPKGAPDAATTTKTGRFNEKIGTLRATNFVCRISQVGARDTRAISLQIAIGLESSCVLLLLLFLMFLWL